MSIVKTEAFVLKSFKYGETSKIVTLFTKDFGKMNAIVKGARNYKSKLCGTLESMNYINAVIYFKENRELQLISGAEYKKSFSYIQDDFDKLEAAYKIIEILSRSVINNDTNKFMFEVLMKTFEKLNDAKENYSLFVLFFLIQLTKNIGLSPDFEDINSDNETFFTKNEFYVIKSEISTLKSLEKCNIDSVGDIKADNEILKKLISTYERFLTNHTLGNKFYKSTKVFRELNLTA